MAKKSVEETVETDHFSQKTLELLRERTEGVPLLITGRRGLGGEYSRRLEYFTAQKKLAGSRYSLSR